MHPEIDRFAHLDTLVHRWDPRWKLAALVVLLFSLGFGGPDGAAPWTESFPPMLAGLAVSLALVRVARIPISFALQRLRYAGVFLGFVVLAYAFQGNEPGGGIGFSATGFRSGLLIFLRAAAMLALIFPMFGTTRFDRTVNAFHALRVPRGLVQIVLFGYRYLFVYQDELRRLRRSMRARGFRPRFDLRTPRVLGSVLGMLLVGSVERTNRIRAAMVARGFSGAVPRGCSFHTRASDVFLAVTVVATGVALATWRVT